MPQAVEYSISRTAKIRADRLLETLLTTAKERMRQIIQEQPDDSSYDEIFRELALRRIIERGLEDSRAGRTISNEEMQRRIKIRQR